MRSATCDLRSLLLATGSEVQSIIIMAGSMAASQAGMVLEKELRVLRLYSKATRRETGIIRQLRGSSLLQWVEPKYRRRPPKPTPQ